MPDRKEAKQALDKVIQKSRVHLYKPIQVAEILYRDRKYGDIDLARLETYRTKSKKWRDDICIDLLGRVCTSSAKFQDNLFEDNAVPPIILEVLGEENRRTSGAVEAYIYRLFSNKHNQRYVPKKNRIRLVIAAQHRIPGRYDLLCNEVPAVPRGIDGILLSVVGLNRIILSQ